MRVKEILQIGIGELSDFSQTSVLDAEMLVCHVLGFSRTELFLKDGLEIYDYQAKQILELFKRRKNNEPIAYLINKKEFYGLDFCVDENVLIPRPDTEILVEEVLKTVENLKLKVKSGVNFRFKIIDVGTGSGCIPISLAMNLERADFVAIDVSQKALEVARKNVEKFGLEERIDLKKSDLLNGLDFRLFGNDTVITANLPYVEESVELEAGVKDYEPHLALFAGEDGLDCYRKLLKQLQEIQPLAIFLEIDLRQVKTLKQISQNLLPEYEIAVAKDLAGKDRVFILKKT